VLAVHAGEHARDVVVLQQFRRRLHVAHHRCARLDRLRRTVQKLFKLRDGERIVAAFSLDSASVTREHRHAQEGRGDRRFMRLR
jgi:hypothetical protein